MPTYQNADATLADIMGGGSVAAQQYFNQDAANAQELAKEQVAQATVPAEIQKPYLGNLFTAAQTANQQGLAQQEQAKGQVMQAGIPSAIGAEQAGNQAKITTQHVEQIQSLGQIVGSLDQQLQGVQGPQRASMVAQFLDSNGVQDPGIRQLMLNASQQPGGLTQISQGLYNASSAARAENIRGGYQLGTAQIGASGRVAGAEASAQARVQVANINAQLRQQMQTFEQASTAAYKRGDKATGDQMAGLALQVRQAQAQLNSQLLFGQPMGIPGAGGSNAQPPQGAEQSQAPQGQPPQVEDAVTAEMRKRGLIK